jgi:hypothetical protein
MDANTLASLRAAAKQKRDKSNSPRWTEMDKRTAYVAFLNSGKESETVTVIGKNAAYIVSQLNAVIKKDGMDEFVYAIEYEGDATLIDVSDADHGTESDS